MTNQLVKDSIKIQEQLNILKTIRQVDIFKDVVTILVDLPKYLVTLQSKDDIKIIDKILSCIFYNTTDSTTIKDLITSLKNYLTTNDKVTFIEYLKITTSEDDFNRLYKTLVSIEEIFDYTNTFFLEEYFPDIVDSIHKLYITTKHNDYIIFMKELLPTISDYLITNDKVSFLEHIKLTITSEVYKVLYKTLVSIEETLSHRSLSHPKDMMTLIENLPEYLVTSTIPDDISIKQYLRLQSLSHYKDYIQCKDSIESIQTKETISYPTLRDSYNIHDSLTIETID